MELPDLFFFIGLPYLALVIFLVGTIYRYREKGAKRLERAGRQKLGDGPRPPRQPSQHDGANGAVGLGGVGGTVSSQ